MPESDGIDAVFGRDPIAEASRTIETMSVVHTSPLRVWTTITDFAGHSSWRPFVQLSGEAVEGGAATYSFRVPGWEKPVTSDASIIRVEKPSAFAWTAGVSGLLLCEESYELESDPVGTRICHKLRFSGLFSRPLVALMRRKITMGLAQADRSLDRHLRRLAAQPAARPSRPTLPPHSVRKGRKRR